MYNKAAGYVCIVTVLVTLASAHMCLMYPAQRGKLVDINALHTAVCDQELPPCGRLKPGFVTQGLRKGSTVQFVLLKNLNHFTSAHSGNFSVSIMRSFISQPEVLATIPDTDVDAPYLYTINVTIPHDLSAGSLVSFSAAYHSGEGISFYQCADVTIL